MSNFLEELADKKTVIVPRGSSMWPFIKEGQPVLIENIQISLYDAVLYKKDQKYILHRLIKIEGNNLTVLGDSQFAEDVIKREDVIAVALGQYKGEKFIDFKTESHVKKVKKWHKRKFIRKVIIKMFRLKNSLEKESV